MKTGKILVINGPNLNRLGKRNPEIYGSRTLAQICDDMQAYAEGMKLQLDFFQSNCEGEIIDAIHSVAEKYDACIINAGAYTHYSYAIRDAIECVDKPFVEVHMSNVHSREEFRHTSVISEVCKGAILGFGEKSYLLAVNAVRDLII